MLKESILLLVTALAYVQGDRAIEVKLPLTVALNKLWEKGHCLKHLDMKNFKQKNFLKGTWYGHLEFDEIINPGAKECCVYEYAPIVKEVAPFLYWKIHKKNAVKHILAGNVFFNETKGATYTEHFDELLGKKGAKVKRTVLDTDYRNYAVLYTCHESNGYKIELAYGITRKLGEKKYDRKIRAAFKKTKLPQNKFLRADKCFEDETPVKS